MLSSMHFVLVGRESSTENSRSFSYPLLPSSKRSFNIYGRETAAAAATTTARFPSLASGSGRAGDSTGERAPARQVSQPCVCDCVCGGQVKQKGRDFPADHISLMDVASLKPKHHLRGITALVPFATHSFPSA